MPACTDSAGTRDRAEAESVIEASSTCEDSRVMLLR